VDYESSHLAEAVSELIVPSGHKVYEEPAAIEEMVRILRLHLEERGRLEPADLARVSPDSASGQDSGR
jgi:hypothetical protein